MQRMISAGLSLAILAFAASAEAQTPRPSRFDESVDTFSERYVLLPGATRLEATTARRTESVYDQAIAYRSTARFVDDPRSAINQTGGAFRPERGVLISVDWFRVEPPFEIGVFKQGRLMDELFCGWGRVSGARRLRCFRDEDRDGRFEAVADGGRLVGSPRGAAVLHFEPIAPQAYARSGHAEDPAAVPSQRLSIITTTAGEGRLRVLLSMRVDAAVTGYRPGILQSEVVDQSTVPSNVTLLGALVRVQSFDSGTASVAVERGFDAGPIELVANAPNDLRQGFSIRILSE